ncbi:hypothetical protein V8G54_016002 [Vigna mungo]|uniref:Uncharacterized protein n=1 Tax=Vigna mungo TaxID=3915 RepID=A0AAQ3NLG8_VIGMU
MKGCFRSISALHLFLGSLTKHFSKKSFPSSDNSSGIFGNSSPTPIRINNFQILEPLLTSHAGFPVTISTTAHPRAQISAGGSYSLSFTDSGDINNGVPLNSHFPCFSPFPLASPKSAIFTSPSKTRTF